MLVRWLLHHQAVVQLSLKAVSQTAQLKEETVYAKLMEAEKVNTFFLSSFFKLHMLLWLN